MSVTKLAAMQSYFFPYIGYFQLISSVDTFVIYPLVTFRKKSWITRNRILEKGNSEPVFFSVPTKKQSSFKLINQTYINNDTNWRKNNLDLLLHNYKGAKHFEEIFEFLSNTLKSQHEKLHFFNTSIIKDICEILDIKTAITDNDPYFPELEIKLKENKYNVDAKSQRVFELCKHYNSTHYINPGGEGRTLYFPKEFKENGIKLHFLSTLPHEYKQFNDTFSPYLSIIDVLMHKGILGTKELLNHYSLD